METLLSIAVFWIQRNESGSDKPNFVCRIDFARSTSLRVSSRSARSATSRSSSASSTYRDALFPTPRLPDDVVPLLRQHLGQIHPDQRLILSDHHTLSSHTRHCIDPPSALRTYKGVQHNNPLLRTHRDEVPPRLPPTDTQ